MVGRNLEVPVVSQKLSVSYFLWSKTICCHVFAARFWFDRGRQTDIGALSEEAAFESSAVRFATILFHSADDKVDQEDAVCTGTTYVSAANATETIAAAAANAVQAIAERRRDWRSVRSMGICVTVRAFYP